jgi:hypothetical protein
MKTITLSEPLLRSLLSLSVKDPSGDTATVGDLLVQANSLIRCINEALDDNVLVQIAAQEAMRENRMRGTGQIRVIDGDLILVRGATRRKIKMAGAVSGSEAQSVKVSEAKPPTRLRDEVSTSTPLPDVKLPPRR